MSKPFSSMHFFLPDPFRNKYRFVSTLSEREDRGIYLGEAAGTKEKVLIKIARSEGEIRRLKNEFQILQAIQSTGNPQAAFFPLPLDRISLPEDPLFYATVRSWVEGRSLESLVEAPLEKPGLSDGETLRITREVLLRLRFLHRMDPPVIHRDIKPQNVIVDRAGHCHLIDLDIARRPKRHEDADTTVIGTRLTAPPEQFGYRPTDERSDLYSVGILMRYCLTGEYTESEDAHISPGMRRVIARATRFDPGDRYPSAAAFLRDLPREVKTVSPRRRRRLGLLAALLTVLVMLVIPVFNSPSFSVTRDCFGGNEALYQEYLNGNASNCAIIIDPEGLHIVTYDPFFAAMDVSEDTSHETVLSAGRLRQILLVLQETPLWQPVTSILFDHLTIETFDPLASVGIPPSTALYFHACALPEDYDLLSGVAQEIREFCTTQCDPLTCESLNFLRGASGLYVLDAVFSDEKKVDLSALEGMKELAFLRLHHTSVSAEELQLISALSNLKALELTHAKLTDITPLSKLGQLEWLNLENNLITDCSPIRGLSHLQVLSLASNEISDISPLADLTSLTYLNLGNNRILDFSPLDALSVTVTDQAWQPKLDEPPTEDAISQEIAD